MEKPPVLRDKDMPSPHMYDMIRVHCGNNCQCEVFMIGVHCRNLVAVNVKYLHVLYDSNGPPISYME